MRRGIALPVAEIHRCRYHPVQGVNHVMNHIRIGVFVNRDPRRSMGDQQEAQTVPNPGLLQIILQQGSDLQEIHLFPRGKAQFPPDDNHYPFLPGPLGGPGNIVTKLDIHLGKTYYNNNNFISQNSQVLFF